MKVRNLLTLHDLYLTDFADSEASEYAEDTLKEDQTGKSITIQHTIFISLKTNNKLLAYYIPFWADTEGVCKALVDQYQPLLPRWSAFEISSKEHGDSDVSSSKNVPFSNKIYFYTETELSAEAIGRLTTLYRDRGVSAQFRSQQWVDYEKLAPAN
jgi:hypothetical protein